jgi:hypothetical protein
VSLNPFSTPKNYPDMLNKIAVFTFCAALLATWVLRHYLVEPDALLSQLDFKIKILDNEITLGYALPAFLFALIARMFKLHDRVSDLFGIRQRFDVNEILVPAFEKTTDTKPTPDLIRDLEKRRKALMGPVFYEYADSTAANPVVGRHLIEKSLGTWEYFWIVVEADVLAAITAVTFLLAYQYRPAVITLGIALLTAPFLLWSYGQSKANAHSQVTKILEDPSRVEAVRKRLRPVEETQSAV